MGQFVEIDEGKQMGVKRFHRGLSELWLARKRKDSFSVFEAVGLAKVFTEGAAVTSPSGTGKIVNPPIKKLARQLASTRATVVSLMAKLFNLEEARDRAKRKHELL